MSLLVWSSLVPPLPLPGVALLVDGVSTVERSLTTVTLRGALVVAFAYPSTLFGFALWNRLIADYFVARVAPFSLLVPVFGLGSAWLFLGEPIGLAELVAAAVVLVGLALVTGRSADSRSRDAGSGLLRTAARAATSPRTGDDGSQQAS